MPRSGALQGDARKLRCSARAAWVGRVGLHLVVDMMHLRPLALRPVALLLDPAMQSAGGDEQHAGGRDGDETERRVPPERPRILLDQRRRGLRMDEAVDVVNHRLDQHAPFCSNARADGFKSVISNGWNRRGAKNRQPPSDYPTGPAPALCSSRKNQSFNACLVVSRDISAIDEVSGIPFGHACTQLAALPQSPTPPLRMSPRSRSLACIFPVG